MPQKHITPTNQLTLFNAPFFMEKPMPGGFRYQEEFITPEEETTLLTLFQTLPFKHDDFNGYTARRRITGFGWHGTPLPKFLLPFIARAETFAGLPQGNITSALISEYSAGTPIGWHRDKPTHGEVLGISLGSTCTFRLRKISNQLPPAQWQRFSVPALPRSIYCMAGESRSHWQHSIPPVEDLRYSITLRNF